MPIIGGDHPLPEIDVFLSHRLKVGELGAHLIKLALGVLIDGEPFAEFERGRPLEVGGGRFIGDAIARGPDLGAAHAIVRGSIDLIGARAIGDRDHLDGEILRVRLDAGDAPEYFAIPRAEEGEQGVLPDEGIVPAGGVGARSPGHEVMFARKRMHEVERGGELRFFDARFRTVVGEEVGVVGE